MKSIIAVIVASFALVACGKKEEAPVTTPAPVAAPVVDSTTKQDAQNVPAPAAPSAPAKTEEAKK